MEIDSEIIEPDHREEPDRRAINVQGRDEMNLAEFPIAALTDYVPRGQNTIRFSDGSGSLLITGSDAYGLPTASDADVVVAMIQLTKHRNTFSAPTVHFTRAELIGILGWPESGKSYKRLTESLMRWSTTSLQYEGTWWDQKARRKINAIFHILNEVVLYERVEPGSGESGPQPKSYFTWNKIFLSSCQAGNLKRLDLRLYFALEHAASKRLYRFLDKRLYREPDQTFDLAEVAFERVGLSRGYVGKKGAINIGKVREKLQPAIEELESRQFLVPLTRGERYLKNGKDWTVRFVRSTSAWPSDDDGPLATEKNAVTKPTVLDELVEGLVSRGVTRSKADDLVTRFPRTMIVEKLELFDWKLASDLSGMKKNPAGWLVKAIEENYPAPLNFEPLVIREAKSLRERLANEASEKARTETRRRNRQDRAVDNYLSRLDPTERACLENEVLASASDETRLNYTSPTLPASLRKALLLGLLREHVASALISPSDQPTLF